MQINDEDLNRVQFRDIKVGNLFKNKYGGYYIKTYSIKEKCDDGSTSFINAVDVRDGIHAYFFPQEDVYECLNACIVVGRDGKTDGNN